MSYTDFGIHKIRVGQIHRRPTRPKIRVGLVLHVLHGSGAYGKFAWDLQPGLSGLFKRNRSSGNIQWQPIIFCQSNRIRGVLSVWMVRGGRVVRLCRTCDREVAGSNPTNGCCVPTPTQRAIPPAPGSVNEYQRKLGSKRAYHVMH